MKPRFHNLTIKDIRKETEDAVSIALEVPEELKNAYLYQAGQHLNFKAIINGEEVRRSYSICTADFENELRVAIKMQPFGKFSTYANTELKTGDSVEVMTPSGVFTYSIDENTAKSFLFFAGGSGVTPIMSHIKTILHKAPNSTVTLVYGNRGFNHIIFREELEHIKNEFMTRFDLIHVFNEEKIGVDLFEGLLNKEKVSEFKQTLFKETHYDEVFVCGPEPMIFAVKDVFEEAGMSSDNVHFELFSSPDDDKKSTATKSVSNTVAELTEMTVIMDDEQVVMAIKKDGPSILDIAIEGGVDAPYSCKGGVCSTCKAKVLEGEAIMDKNYALEEDELEQGYILTCQAHPTTAKIIVSYDD